MIKLYNSLTKSKKIFTPIKPGIVKMYSCGPTVYDHAHIGNLRSDIFVDTLQKVLRLIEGYKVDWVMNITDIDDRMIAKLQKDYPNDEPAIGLKKISQKYTDIFLGDIAKVGIDKEDISHLVLATEHIDKMQELIKHLLRQKIAYVSDGSIYFSIEQYKQQGGDYGQLVNIDYDAQARVTDDQDQKEGVSDFALWKAQKAGEPSWDFEWLGDNLPGRPGWHIECSAMSTEYLGKPFDIHTGGVDLKFPHHENEIAQCGGAQANFFVHNEHLNVETEKMSKSKGNFTTIDDVEDPLAFRLLCLQAHYRSQMEYGAVSLQSAHDRLNALRSYVDKMVLAWPNQLPEKDSSKQSEQFVEEVFAALRDDLNTPAALAAFSHIENKVFSLQTLKAISKFEEILSIKLVDSTPLTSEQRALITDYDNARENKQYVESDQIRSELKDKHSLQISDTEYGPLVNRIRS